MKRLSIITTHPIQYNAPWMRLLSERRQIEIKVFYTWSQAEEGSKFDPGFGKNVAWDVPLLSGYHYEFVKNTSSFPGTSQHNGIINPELINIIGKWRPDAVLVIGWNFKSHLQCINFFHNKIPVLFRGDSTLLDNQTLIKRIMRKTALKTVYKKVDYAFYAGTQNKKYFLEFGLPPERLVFAPHAIDNARFAPSDTNKKVAHEFRSALNIGEESVVFLYAGKFQEKKDVLFLLNVFLKLNYTGVHLVLTGNGELEPALKLRAAHTPNVHFMDFQNQQMMPAVYQLADVFVLPSKGPGETWGLSVNEAMASGKPVLVSDKCGCAVDLVEEGKTGYTFRSADETHLKDKIELMVQHEDQLEEMGQNAFEKIQDWSFENLVTGIENLVMHKC